MIRSKTSLRSWAESSVNRNQDLRYFPILTHTTPLSFEYSLVLIASGRSKIVSGPRNLPYVGSLLAKARYSSRPSSNGEYLTYHMYRLNVSQGRIRTQKGTRHALGTSTAFATAGFVWPSAWVSTICVGSLLRSRCSESARALDRVVWGILVVGHHLVTGPLTRSLRFWLAPSVTG